MYSVGWETLSRVPGCSGAAVLPWRCAGRSHPRACSGSARNARGDRVASRLRLLGNARTPLDSGGDSKHCRKDGRCAVTLPVTLQLTAGYTSVLLTSHHVTPRHPSPSLLGGHWKTCISTPYSAPIHLVPPARVSSHSGRCTRVCVQGMCPGWGGPDTLLTPAFASARQKVAHPIPSRSISEQSKHPINSRCHPSRAPGMHILSSRAMTSFPGWVSIYTSFA